MLSIPGGTVMLLASRTRACLAALVLTTGAARAQQRPFTHEQALWIVAATGGAPRRLSEGHAPAVSPKGDRVAFLNKGQIWWAPLADSAKPEQLVHARGSAQSLRWSPDGSKLAFVSSRGDHGFVGVYDVATKALRFLDPSVDERGEPGGSQTAARAAAVWSPR